jgi:PKD repeat protein
VQHSRISGQTEWAQVSFALTQPGDVVLRWTYSKDGSGVVGEDAAFLDTLSILEPNQRTAAFRVSGAFAHEADGTREVTALLDEAAPADLYVPYALSGTATTGDDYTIAPAAFFFAAGDTQAVVTVTLTDDALAELAETLILTLLPTNNVTVASPSQHTLTLLPSDFPQAQPGLIGWWRADDGVITNAAGGVTNWLDRSGYRQAFAQTSDTRCPMWLADAANGKPAVRFDLTDDGMASGLNVQAPYTVYLVYASQDPSTAARRALQGSSNWLLGPYQGKQRHYAGGWVDDASLTTVTGRYTVCTVRNTGTASTFWVDGVNRTVYADATGAPGILHLGASGYASSEKLGGDIVEILVYDRALDDAEAELPGDALSAAYRLDTAYSPTVITLATQDQTLPEGTRQWTVEGTASGPAETLFWSNRVSGTTGTVPLPPNGNWQVTLPLARGANQFSFWTLHSTAATLSLTVSGALEPFAVAMNDSGELRLARWKTDMHAFESWQPFDSVMGNGYARGLAVGDFDNDGFNDILAFRPSGPRHAVATLFKNDGSNRFVRAGSALVTGYNSSYVMRCAAADFNLDGHLDVALTGNGNNIPVFLLLGDGTGRFTQRNVPVVNGYGRGLTSADFDHDGCPDLAVSFYSSGAVHVLYGRGDGTFEPPVQIGTVSNDPYGLVALDVNQDGHPDLLCRSGGSAQTTLFAGNGNRQFAAGVSVPTLALGQHAGFAAYDFTEDGIPDLLSATEYALRYHQGYADGSYTQRTTTAWSYTLGMAATPQAPPPGTPVVRLAADAPVATVGQTVQFTPVVTGAAAASTLWRFDDGNQASGSPAGVQHAFGAPGRYTVRLTATAANGWKGVGTCSVTVTGAVSAVSGGERLLPESEASNGVWRVTLDRAQILPGAAPETRYVVTPDVHMTDTFEDGTADSRWRMPTLPWSVSDANPINGSHSFAQTNETVNHCVALLDLPGLRAPYEIRTTFRVVGSTSPHAGVIFERQRTGLGLRYCWLRGQYDDVVMTLPDGSEASCPVGFDLQANQQHRLTVRVAGGLARIWLNGTFYGAVPADGLPCVGLCTYRSSVLFDDVAVDTLGAEGADLRPDVTEDAEDGRATAWRATAGTWAVTTNSPVIGGTHSLRQSNASIDRGTAIYEGAVIPAGDFLFETDVEILGGNGWEVMLRLGAPEWNTYYEVILRGRDGTDDLLVYRYADGGSAQTVTNLKQTVGWLLPPNDSFRIGAARIGTALQITHNGAVMAVIENEPRVAEICAFGIATYRTDALFDKIGRASCRERVYVLV